MVLGGALVALFEVPFQYAIAGLGVAPAVALLYTAPVTVAIAGHFILREKLTPLRIALAVGVMIGVWLTVHGEVSGHSQRAASRLAGILGGLIAAGSYAATAALACYSVPRYGSKKMLYWELLGGLIFLAILLPMFGRTPAAPLNVAAWAYIAALGIGAVIAANFLFFAAMKRIDAAPASVAASVEPLVGALLGLLMFAQQLSGVGGQGLVGIGGGVDGGMDEVEGMWAWSNRIQPSARDRV